MTFLKPSNEAKEFITLCEDILWNIVIHLMDAYDGDPCCWNCYRVANILRFANSCLNFLFIKKAGYLLLEDTMSGGVSILDVRPNRIGNYYDRHKTCWCCLSSDIYNAVPSQYMSPIVSRGFFVYVSSDNNAARQECSWWESLISKNIRKKIENCADKSNRGIDYNKILIAIAYSGKWSNNKKKNDEINSDMNETYDIPSKFYKNNKKHKGIELKVRNYPNRSEYYIDEFYVGGDITKSDVYPRLIKFINNQIYKDKLFKGLYKYLKTEDPLCLIQK